LLVLLMVWAYSLAQRRRTALRAARVRA
jgi:hypothetical protein